MIEQKLPRSSSREIPEQAPRKFAPRIEPHSARRLKRPPGRDTESAWGFQTDQSAVTGRTAQKLLNLPQPLVALSVQHVLD